MHCVFISSSPLYWAHAWVCWLILVLFILLSYCVSVKVTTTLASILYFLKHSLMLALTFLSIWLETCGFDDNPASILYTDNTFIVTFIVSGNL